MMERIRIRVGVSKCLLGEPVRYDGQHKHDHFITDTLGPFFEFVGVCPEVECGLGVPRETVRLVGDPADPRLVTTRTGIDHTARMKNWCTTRVRELESEELFGFIFKARSPSSGMENVKVYNEKGGYAGKAPGLFGRAFMEHFPNLPCEEEGRLNDPDLRENFLERVFTLWRFRQSMQDSPTLAKIMEFHARNKFLIQAHNETLMREMGRMLAGTVPRSAKAFIPRYEAMLMRALKYPATPRKHTNILQHMLGYLRQHIENDDRHELLEVIRQYHAGFIPLIVPITLLRHHVTKHKIPYLLEQYYLDPHPMELKLRNHA